MPELPPRGCGGRRSRPMLRADRVALGALLAVTIVAPAAAAPKKAHDPAAVERLETETGALVALSDATGAARFARAERGKALGSAGAKDKKDHSLEFLAQHGRAFGLRDAQSELKLEGVATDRIGGSHVTYSQQHHGVPVFGTALKAHYDEQGNLEAVNGTVVPDIEVSVSPTRSADEAGAAALKQVSASDATVRGSRLVVFREGLAKGVEGDNHLAYEVEVGNGGDVREFVYVDAHTGKVIDQISGIHEGLDRRAYDAGGAPAPGPNYP